MWTRGGALVAIAAATVACGGGSSAHASRVPSSSPPAVVIPTRTPEVVSRSDFLVSVANICNDLADDGQQYIAALKSSTTVQDKALTLRSIRDVLDTERSTSATLLKTEKAPPALGREYTRDIQRPIAAMDRDAQTMLLDFRSHDTDGMMRAIHDFIRAVTVIDNYGHRHKLQDCVI